MSAAERAYVVERAASWIGTPYHHMGQLKRVGTDCAMLLYRVWVEAGMLEPMEIESYPADWHLNRSTERYASKLLEYCTEMPSPEERRPLPADILLFKFGRAFAHGVIVTTYPMGIHAHVRGGTTMTNVLTDPYLSYTSERKSENFGLPRLRKVYCFNRWLP